MLADGHSVTRYLYLCEELGIRDSVVKVDLAERLLVIADDPQQCSNAALALSRQGVDAENTVRYLTSKLLAIQDRVLPQDSANVFLALYERGWTIDREVAIALLHTYLPVIQWSVGCDSIQVLAGLEKHAVVAEDVDVSPIVVKLMQDCPTPLHVKLGTVATSL